MTKQAQIPVTVQIGTTSRIFHLVPTAYGSLVSLETYGVRYRTGQKLHERRLSFMLDADGNPTQFNPSSKRFEVVNLSDGITLHTERGVSYGNRNSTETPYFLSTQP